MISLHLNQQLPFAPSDLLDMVADVEKYPEYIPYIQAVRILRRKNLSENRYSFIADVHLQYKMFSEVFRSEVIVDHGNHQLSITRSGQGGAVRSLSNKWEFVASDAGTDIGFDLSVALKLLPLEFIVKQKIDSAIDKIMKAFEQRAYDKLSRIDAM